MTRVDETFASTLPLSDTPLPRAKAIFIAVAHLLLAGLATIALCNRTNPQLESVELLFAGMLFGQANLLGIWAGLSGSRWYWRFLGVACGALYLGGVFQIGTRDPAITAVATVLVVPLAAFLLTVRHFGLRIARGDSRTESRIQYSVRDLIILTSLIALLLSVVRSLAPLLPPLRGNPADFLSEIVIITTGLAIAGAIPLWPILGAKCRPLVSASALLLACAAVSAFCEFYLRDRWSWQGLPLFIANAITIIVTLFIVRHWGVRIEWRPPQAAEAAAALDLANARGRLSLTALITGALPNAHLICFVIVHLALGGLAAAILSHGMRGGPDLVNLILFGFLCGQATLLGMWAGLSGSRWYWRLIGVGGGAIYLGAMFAVLDAPHVAITIPILIAPSAAAALLVRGFGLRAAKKGEASAGAAQFSLRDILLLTAFVAGLLSVGRTVQVLLALAPPGLGRDVFQGLCLAASFAILGLVPLWPILGPKHRPLLVIAATTVAAVAVGAFIGALIEFHLSWAGISISSAVTATVVASLYALRLFGVRLVRRPWRNYEPELFKAEDAADGSPAPLSAPPAEPSQIASP